MIDIIVGILLLIAIGTVVYWGHRLVKWLF